MKATEERSLNHVNQWSVHHFGPDWNVPLHHVRILTLAMHCFAKVCSHLLSDFWKNIFPTGKIHMTKVNSGLMVRNFLSCSSNALNDESRKKKNKKQKLSSTSTFFFSIQHLYLAQANKCSTPSNIIHIILFIGNQWYMSNGLLLSNALQSTYI